MDPDTRRLVMFAGGLGVVLVVLIGISTLMGHHSTEVPVVTADPRPIRVKPENPGGMKIDGAENDVFSGGTDTANSKLAPPAETPDAKALLAPPPTAQAPASVVANAPPPLAKQAVPAVEPRPVAEPRSAAVASAPVARVAPPPVAPAPAAQSKPAAAAVEAHASASGHQPIVQLAALTSEEAAHNEWQQLEKRMPELMNGRQPLFSRTERNGHTFWRVRTAGFVDVAQARAFCDHVRQKGGGCSVADF